VAIDQVYGSPTITTNRAGYSLILLWKFSSKN